MSQKMCLRGIFFYWLVTSLFIVRATVQLIEQFFLQNIIERDGIMFL
jgi:hypothetical protein